MNMDSGVTLRLRSDIPGSADGRRMRALSYDILADGVRVGTCELRPEMAWTAYLGGQISYTVFPAFRGHRYALGALQCLLGEAKAFGLKELLVTCRPENRASRRILELAGAAFEGVHSVPSGHPLSGSDIRRVCVYRLIAL